MRHAYVADVGDFGKYGLLRALHRARPTCRIGVNWYLTDMLESNNDGRHDGYLRGPAAKSNLYRDCDPDLFDRLVNVRAKQQLTVRLIESESILPSGTLFYQRVIPGGGDGGRKTGNWNDRKEWLAAAFDVLSEVDLVFVDPDNGIVFHEDSVGVEQSDRMASHKHAYWNELESLLKHGKSVVAYHHLGRQRGGHIMQIDSYLAKIRSRGYRALGIHYRRGSARVFFVIPANAAHSRWLFHACGQFAESWSAHCRLAQGDHQS